MTIQTFNLTRDQIINRAFNLLNEYEATETPSAADSLLAQDFLNMMVKHWAAQGIHLFERTVGYLFLQPSQTSYLLDSSSSDHFTQTYIQTVLTNSYNSGTTNIIVNSVTNISVNDNIGIVLDTGFLYWTTVSSINSGTKTITLSAATPSHITAGAQIYDYTSNFDKPLKIHQSFRRDTRSNTDIPLFADSSEDYINRPVKFSTGQPVEYYYDIQVMQGNFYLWPTPNIATDIIGFVFDKRINDFVNATDYPDFPNEWLRAIVYNLAVELAPVYGKYDEISYLQPRADQLLKEVLDFDQEQIDLNFIIRQWPTGARG